VTELSAVAQGSRRAETDTEGRGQAASPAPSAENPKVTVTVAAVLSFLFEDHLQA
jgi:hypothetical protein